MVELSDRTGMEVRAASVEDAAAIALIHVRGWQWAYADIIAADYLDELSVPAREATWASGLRNGVMPDGGSIYVADLAGKVQGWMTCGPSRDQEAVPGVGELHGIYVDPLHIGRGVGAALLAFCVQELKRRGFDAATLWVLSENYVAREWYERRGWLPDGTEQSFTLGEQELAEVRYVRVL